MKKTIWRPFSRIIECDKPHRPVFKGATSIPTFTVEVIKAFLWDLRSCWKHRFLKKRQTFQWKKIIDLFFSFHRAWQTSGNNIKVCVRYSGKCCGSNKNNSLGPKRLLKTKKFWEKKQTFQWKTICGYFSLVISNMKNVREHFLKSTR